MKNYNKIYSHLLFPFLFLTLSLMCVDDNNLDTQIDRTGKIQTKTILPYNSDLIIKGQQTLDKRVPDVFQRQSITNGIELNLLTVIKTITVDGDTGFLCRYKNGKSCLILQGSSYNMGYQVGALKGDEVYKMTTEYLKILITSIFSISYDKMMELYNFIYNEMILYSMAAMENGSIPEYLIEEMQGMEDGARAKGYDVRFNDILILNMGSDILYSFLNMGKLYSPLYMLEDLISKDPSLKDIIKVKDGKVYFQKSKKFKFGCNEIVLSGDATINGNTYHGRDFMYYTGGIYQNVAGMFIYIPDDGYPFLCISTPGWVGQITALNSHGLSMGVDTLVAKCVNSEPGMGCAFVIRDIIQFSRNLDDAIDNLKLQNRSVPWIFVLADDTKSDRYSNGVVVESGRSDPPFNGPDLLPRWERYLLYLMTDLIEDLDSDQMPDKGIMLRTLDWTFPDEFKNIDISLFKFNEEIQFNFHFPEQMEDWPDVAIATNHYIIPRMRFCSLTPYMMYLENKTMGSTYFRYNKLIEIIEIEYGRINFNIAQDIIDYLNPNSIYNDIIGEYYYKPGTEVQGHHAIIDNNNLTMRGLFGYYGKDPDHKTSWVTIDLKPFLINEKNKGNALND